jgi:hexokinase
MEDTVRNLRMAVMFMAILISLLLGGVAGFYLGLNKTTAGTASNVDTESSRYRALNDEVLDGEDTADYSGTEGSLAQDDDNEYLPDTSTKLKNEFKIRGKYYPYKDTTIASAQAAINANPATLAATWGGKHKLKVDDKKSTHIIGHNPGMFSILPKLKVGEKIVVYDYRGKKRTYTIKEATKVDDEAYTVKKPKKDYWDVIADSGKKEQIVLQTCLSKTTNLVIVAR